MAGIGEMADVVIGEVGRRIAQRLVAAGAVEGRRDANLAALRPDRIVIVEAVDAEDLVPDSKARRVRIIGRDRWNPPRHGAPEHADLGAELLRHEFQFGDRLVRRVHRDDRGRGHAVAEILEIAGRDDVIGADHGAPCLVVDDARQAQPGGRVDDGEIGADFVEALVQEMRHHRGGAVEGISGLPGPEARHGDLAATPLRRAHLQRAQGRVHRGEVAIGRLVASHLAHLLRKHRIVFDPMPIAVDDRVVEFGTNLRWAEVGVTAHGFLRNGGISGAILGYWRPYIGSLHRRYVRGNPIHERRSKCHSVVPTLDRQGVPSSP